MNEVSRRDFTDLKKSKLTIHWFTPITHFTSTALKVYKCISVSHPSFLGLQKTYDIHDLGTFVTGESRLLFSSAQVDYIRYWLHTMQLTKDIIPLPYSDCLLTESNLRNVSPVVYNDGGSLRNALKV